ncbi:hypothetical protein [Rhodococcus jostii]|uniref:Uncharacterized protein n=1 Tax=Rhodococcus jostii TaxID=132919 RepID=A0A1H4QSZ8_RHOJO|nr:hypothetical protein [Rhodococcus jostii]SEC22785.1 hypothetical protein SAMN04490220_1109 [Rhodococcus jostii]
MSPIDTAVHTPARSGVITRVAAGMLPIAGAAAVWGALLGPAWTYVPAQPQANVPAAELSFAALAAATAESTSSVQVAYFSWLAWAFAVVTTALMILLAITRNLLIAALSVVAGAFQLVVTVLAVKGPLPWSVFFEGLPNIRIGAVLALSAIALLIAGGVFVLTATKPSRSPIGK